MVGLRVGWPRPAPGPRGPAGCEAGADPLGADTAEELGIGCEHRAELRVGEEAVSGDMGPAGTGEFLDQPGRASLRTLEPEDLAARRQPADGIELLQRARQLDPAVLAASLGLRGSGGQELLPRPLVVHRPGLLAIGYATDGQQQSGGAVVAGRLRRGEAPSRNGACGMVARAYCSKRIVPGLSPGSAAQGMKPRAPSGARYTVVVPFGTWLASGSHTSLRKSAAAGLSCPWTMA